MDSHSRMLVEEASRAIKKIGARSMLLEAAMRVIVKHKLTDELVEAMAEAKADNAQSIDTATPSGDRT